MAKAIIYHNAVRCEACKHTLFGDVEDNVDLTFRCLNAVCPEQGVRFMMPEVTLVPYTGGGNGKFTPTQGQRDKFKHDPMVS